MTKPTKPNENEEQRSAPEQTPPMQRQAVPLLRPEVTHHLPAK